ncbi:MAG: methylase [Myxococcaceae bacterium]|nr:methylase [Myxococcaceae bacterium]
MRARTRPGRLHAFDGWLALEERALLSAPGLLVDLGFGASAITTFELSQAFPAHQVLGLELDAARVEAARREFPQLDVRVGSLDSSSPTAALVVRIANVARGMTKPRAAELHTHAARWLVEGGVCLEGSTDVEGHVSSFWVLRKRGGEVVREALVFQTDFARGFSPWLFRDVLPRALRRDVRPGTAIGTLLEQWADAWQLVRGAEPEPSFRASLERLSLVRADVSPRLASGGYCVWLTPPSEPGAFTSES